MWPLDQVVTTDVLLTVSGDVVPLPDVVLVAQDTEQVIPTRVTRHVDCLDRPYNCAAQYAPLAELAPNTVWDVVVDDWEQGAFTTRKGVSSVDIPEAPPLSRGAIDISRDPNYSGYSASWQIGDLMAGEWVEFEVRGDGVTAPDGMTSTSRVVLGNPVCGSYSGDPGELSNAEVRARRVTPTGIVGEWSEWTDVDPALTTITEDPEDWLEQSACYSVPARASWLALPLVLLGLRRRTRAPRSP